MDTIFIDIDGTVADSIPWWMTLYNHDNWKSYTKYDLTSYDPIECIGIDISPYYMDYRGVSMVNGFASAFLYLKQYYNIVFVTAGFGTDWLRAQGIDNEVIQSKSRKYLKGYALIDDYDKNLLEFEGEKFLMEQPWSMKSEHYIPVTWEEITEVLLERINAPDRVYDPTRQSKLRQSD